MNLSVSLSGSLCLSVCHAEPITETLSMRVLCRAKKDKIVILIVILKESKSMKD